MSEYAKNIQRIEDMWKKRIELRMGRTEGIMTELLPCPFCGGEADEYEGDYGNGIYCMMCGAMVGEPIHLEYRTTKRVSIAEAIAAWNSRAERTCENVSKWKDECLKCSECGCITDYVSYEDEPYMMTDEGATLPNYCPNCGAKVVGE